VEIHLRSQLSLKEAETQLQLYSGIIKIFQLEDGSRQGEIERKTLFSTVQVRITMSGIRGTSD
jgi:hypothetical protein